MIGCGPAYTCSNMDSGAGAGMARQASRSQNAGETDPAGPLVERDPPLPLQRRGDGPLVVLAEEHHRRVVDRGPDERLVHVALAGGAVAEVGDHRLAGFAEG